MAGRSGMFRVLIADDEKSVAESLVSSIPWEELEIQVAGTAADGRTALELAEKEMVDIAILDIRMPGLNGLELCERLRERNERIQLIIVSGYAEFAYAEKAIQYGVIGYCLKPLDYVQVTRFLRRAIQNLKRDRQLPVQGDLMEVLERQDEDEIRECLGGLGLVCQGGYYIGVSCGERKLEISPGDGISLRLGRRQWGYILKQDWFGGCSMEGRSSPAEESVQEQGRWEEEQLKKNSAVPEGIGYLGQPIEGRAIYEGFEECTARAYQFFIEGAGTVCCCLDESRANSWVDAIQEKVQGNQWGSVSSLLEKIKRDGVADFTVRSALRLGNLLLSNPCLRDEENDSYIYSVEQLVNTYGSFREMLGCLQQSLAEGGSRKEEDGNFTNASFMKLMHYINENYKTEISLMGAAQMLHMSANYVSQLFKRESGTTFVHYVTQKRLEDAKELLTATKKPLTDIALEVGFNDTFHFIKTFKKFTGMTPGQYRAGV